MAVKEVSIKVTVQGQELVITNKNAELFQKTVEGLKEELNKLGERSEKNAEIFDRLTGDLQALEQVFTEVKDEAKDTGDKVEEGGDKAEGAGKKTKSYAAQIKELKLELQTLGERTDENGEQYDRLKTQIADLSEKQEDLQIGTKKLDDSLSAIPGPIGKAASTFKGLDDGLKNAKSAMSNLTKQFPLLQKAWVATGIGALVIVVGLLVAAVMKAFSSFKPLQDAVGKLGIAFKLLGDLVQPIIDLIGQGLTVVLEGVATAIAWVTGSMEEYNKEVANAKATAELEKNLQQQEDFLDANGYKYDEFTKRKIQANIDYNKKKLELDKDETRSEAEKQALLKQYRDKADNEIKQAQQDREQKEADAAKAAREKAQSEAEKRRQIEEDFQNRLTSVQRENAALRLTNVNATGQEELQIRKKLGEDKLKQDYDDQIKEINNLKVTEKKKKELREQTLQNYELKSKQFNDEILKEQRLANEELIKSNRDLQTSLIQNEEERALKEAENRRNDAIKALKDSKASAEEIAKAKLLIDEKYEQDKDKITKAAAERRRQFEGETLNMSLENRLKSIDLFTIGEVEKVEQRDEVLKQQNQKTLDDQRLALQKQLENKEIDQTQFDTRMKEYNTAFDLSEVERTRNTEEQIRQTKYNIRQKALDDLISIVGEETKVGKALLLAKQVLAAKELIMEIKKNITFAKGTLFRSKAAAAEGAAQTGKVGFPQNIPLLIGYAAQVASIISAVTSALSLSKEGGEGGGDVGPGTVRGMERGGMIGGRRHAQGGTLIEAEQGEAIMNRGSVTLFGPMLSAMNQMGGGTSFNRNALMTSFDAPTVDKPMESQEAPVFKTYVVSNELTTEQERQARLKNLSTL